MNFWPCYRGSGGRIVYIAGDWKEVRVELRLSLRTRNYVGSIFGGSLYAAVDPIYMLMLIKCLGPGYVVWDKAATIRFRKPGRRTLTAAFKLDDSELEEIKLQLETVPKLDRTYRVELLDANGLVHAEIEKVIHISRKSNN
ncbi:MAG: DUF4442 domain-containing protein [Holophagaceae bacterium]|nr:DUF4442 domain-containing protein [Holophagaceae bacterium]